jgi:hypothetical protein
MSYEPVVLKRDVEAIQIPYGQKTKLPKGSPVEITQELGGSFTVLTDLGLMRIEGKDADALGRESAQPLAEPVPAPTDAKAVATEIWNQLKTCYDPEIPVNFDPPWTQSMMSDAAKLQLGMM